MFTYIIKLNSSIPSQTQIMAEQEEREHCLWSDIPSDLLYLIAKKLPYLLDFIRFRSTCKSWHSLIPISDSPLRFPWLLEFHQTPSDPISAPTTSLRLHSLSSGETLTIPIKRSNWFRGTSHHYLPIFDDRTGTISLINPLNNDEFVPPPIHDPHGLFSPWMVCTETGPVHDRRILIVDHHSNYMKNQVGLWAIYDPHHGKWNEERGSFNNFCYYQGMLFSTHFGSETKVFHVSSKKLLYKIPPPEDEMWNVHPPRDYHGSSWLFKKSYVVESCREILRVYWYYAKEILVKSVFHIYRLNFEGVDRQPRWVKVSDIGDQILFLEVKNGFSMIAAPATGFVGGRIYFIDPCDGAPYVHDIAAGTVETVPSPFKKCTWFVPGLS